MKTPSLAPAYVAFYPTLSEICNSHGYALTVHGSMVRDFDLLAVPWTDGPKNESALIMDISKYLSMFDGIYGKYLCGEPENKPHGRTAYLFNLGMGVQIDFGVIKTKDQLPESTEEYTVSDYKRILTQLSGIVKVLSDAVKSCHHHTTLNKVVRNTYKFDKDKVQEAKNLILELDSISDKKD